MSQPQSFLLRLTRSTWTFPSGIAQGLTITYAGGTQYLTGIGQGNEILVSLGNSNFAPFLHEFTAYSMMGISFDSDEDSPWSIDLAKTTSAITALGQCTIEHGFAQLPKPWGAAQPTGSTTTVPSTPVASSPPPAANQSVAADQGTALAICRGLSDSLERLRCYDAISLQGPQTSASGDDASSAPSTNPAASTPQAASPSAPAANVPQTASSAEQPNAGSCKDDWQKCKDNSDLANHYDGWYKVQAACETKVNEEVEYGTPVWPGFFSGGAFTRFQKGADYISTGVAVAIESNVQIQNGFGAMVHSTAYCRYDLKSETVLDVTVSPN